MKTIKSTLLSLFLSFLFFSCSIITGISNFGKIFHEYDEFKDQKHSFVRFVFDAKPLTNAFAYNRYTQIEFSQIKKNNSVKSFINLSMRLNIDEKIETLFFLKTDNQLIKMHFDSIQYHQFHEINNSNSTEVATTKEKDKDEEDQKTTTTTTTTVKTNEYDYNKVRTRNIELQANTIKQLLSTETLIFRYYIKNQAYSYSFSPKEIETIKILLKSYY